MYAVGPWPFTHAGKFEILIVKKNIYSWMVVWVYNVVGYTCWMVG